jgi:hypothetical protein
MNGVDHEKSGGGQPGIISHLWNRRENQNLVIHETSQAIFIGNESLLSNLTALLHEMMKNPDCIKTLRTELDRLDIGTYGHEVWRDPKVMQLPYLVSKISLSGTLSAAS